MGRLPPLTNSNGDEQNGLMAEKESDWTLGNRATQNRCEDIRMYAKNEPLSFN